MNKEKKLIFLVGRTAVGKDSVAKCLPYDKVVSFTTRPMRKGEENGVEHFFVDDDTMDKILDRDDVIAFTQIGDYRYCATLESIKSDVAVYIIDPEGIEWFKTRGCPQKCEYVTFYITASSEERHTRSERRGDDIDTFHKRAAAEICMFAHFEAGVGYDYAIHNKDVKKTAAAIMALLDI